MLRIQNQQLAETDRRKDEFLAVLAHELRNPLAPLTNALEVLLDGSAQDQKADELHQVMARQVRHLTRLVDDLLDLCRISSGKLELSPEPSSLQRLIGHALEACRSRLNDAKQDVNLVGPEEPLVLSVDPVRFVQVLINLLNNASRYSDLGKSIYVDWGKDDDKIFVAVRDEGRGIAPEAQERIFDMFVQEREGGRGLGLGLTLVKQIVEMHEGSVRVFSEGRGEGSTFIVELPPSALLDASPEQIPESRIPMSPREDPPLRIALVEDDDDVRETMLLLLEQWGHFVEVAADGQTGVQLVLDMKPQVALLDIGMPVLDGLGAAAEICKRMGESRPKLIALSGYGQKKDREQSKKAGFDLHLVKPAEPAALRQALAELSQGTKWRPPAGKRSSHKKPKL
jgi:CheY-like chemotaxis protein/two-component sensor histidine kinase